MDPACRLPLRGAALVLSAVVAAEMAVRPLLPVDQTLRMAATGVLRALEAAVLLVWVSRSRSGLPAIGLSRAALAAGLRSGLIGAAVCGAAAAIAGGIAQYRFNIDFVAWIRVGVPRDPVACVTVLLVAGLVSPLAEETFFRGVLYGALRRFGAPAAIVGSTVLFAAAHAGGGFPTIQIIGGAVFALAMEKSRSLVAPVVIHVLGNLSIYAVSMISSF